MPERELRENVLPTLLRALYYFDVRVLHGPKEEGKLSPRLAHERD